jgi:hypothetical protein
MTALGARRMWRGVALGCVLLCFSTAVSVARGQSFTVKVSMETTGQPQEIENSAEKLISFVNPHQAFVQAGGHPYALTTRLEFPTETVGQNLGEPDLAPVQDPRDIVTDLPRGLLGNPQVAPACPIVRVVTRGEPCPSATQIGFFVVHRGKKQEEMGPIVNLVPEKGQSAEFGLVTPLKFTYLLTAHVIRLGKTYGLSVVSNGIPIAELYSAELTFWGVPSDPSHDRQRGLTCSRLSKLQICNGGNESSGSPPRPFLTMPANCRLGPDRVAVLADSWQHPGAYVEGETTLPPMEGCDRLRFEPTIAAQPDTLLADAPMGLGFTLESPQAEGAGEPGAPQISDSTVTLPQGVSINPGIVDGIQACERTGPNGINIDGPESEEIALDGEPQLAPGHCPDASIIGTAKLFTPELAAPVEGHVYLAKPLCGPGPGEHPCGVQDALDGDLYQLYLELGGVGALADAGVNIKLRGRTEANPATGQLTTVFEDTPELPFGKLELHLNGGPRAPLANPAVCGDATTTSDFTPWSAPGRNTEGLLVSGTPDATPSSSYMVLGCSSPPGLQPGLHAGTVTPQAGKYSSFSFDLSRGDREQYVKGVQVKTPPGLLGMLSNVPLCGAADAEAGACLESSKIGTTRVASGAGSHPFEISGDVYLTGPYDGAPFGLSFVTHVEAGPFNLGLVVVRARIQVDRHDSTLTVTTDEQGPHALPQILDGVPLRLKRVTVEVTRPSFMFNPTNCAAQRIEAIVSGSQNGLARVSVPFAAAGCKSLAFKPAFRAATSGRTSRRAGASLDVKLTYPAGSVGNEANVAKVKVDLPKQLPSRLTTLQQACAAARFEADPASCPRASVVGTVRSSTPVLPVQLTGPVYFVSHGGEAFPSLVIVLEGDGVRVDLTGSTFIDERTRVTSSTFKSVPDVPVSSFELFLPQGSNSALAANGNLCKLSGRLKMPTRFVAQNGLVLKQNTTIAVTGCRKARPARATRHGRHSR